MRAPSKQVLVEHDDGCWYPAGLLDQYRGRGGAWRVVVTYSTEPGSTYLRAMPADQCRAVDDPPPGWVDPRETSRGPAPLVTPAGAATPADAPP